MWKPFAAPDALIAPYDPAAADGLDRRVPAILLALVLVAILGPGLVIVMTAINMLADGPRDILDPRLRQQL